jgi:hypothetical protein
LSVKITHKYKLLYIIKQVDMEHISPAVFQAVEEVWEMRNGLVYRNNGVGIEADP